MTFEHGHTLIVGARTDLAVTVSADGVHLPEHGVSVTSVLRSFPTLAVSRSCHDRQGLQRAQEEGASWATLSPFRAPRSKPSARAPLGEGEFQRRTAGLKLPVVALGGLDVTDVSACKRAGAVGLAVSGALFESTTPEGLLERFLMAWREAL